MKKKINNSSKLVIAASVLSLAVLAVFSRKKLIAAKEVISNLKVDVHSVSNINWQFPNVFFDAILKITNPTNIDFGATLTSKIKIKKVRAFTSAGVFLGEAQTNLYSIDLPANSYTMLPSANVQVEGLNMIENTLNNLILQDNNNFFNGIKFKVDIEVFGKTLTLDA